MLKLSYQELLAKIVLLEGVNHVDMFAGQYLNEADGEELPFTLPAIFIEFTEIPTNELGQGNQEGDALLRFHIVSEVVMNEVSNITPEAIRNTALEHLDLIDRFHAHMNKFAGTNFNSLSRVLIEADTDPSDIYVHIASYMTRFTDTSAVKKYIKVNPNLNIDKTLNA